MKMMGMILSVTRPPQRRADRADERSGQFDSTPLAAVKEEEHRRAASTRGRRSPRVQRRQRRPRIGDLGYWLIRDAGGHGIATTPVGLLVEWTLQNLDIDGIEAFVHDDSVR
jgi:RimJ/RimL family protein N-acetyltransferase